MDNPEARLSVAEDSVELVLDVPSRLLREVVVLLYELLMRSVLMVLLLMQGKVDVCRSYRCVGEGV
jgi:hypothetical protein